MDATVCCKKITEVWCLCIQRTTAYDYKVDVYALGLVLVEILCPFKTENERVDSLQQMRNNPVTLPAEFIGDFPNQVGVFTLLYWSLCISRSVLMCVVILLIVLVYFFLLFKFYFYRTKQVC